MGSIFRYASQTSHLLTRLSYENEIFHQGSRLHIGYKILERCLDVLQPINIHEQTAQTSLHYLGFTPTVYQQGFNSTVTSDRKLLNIENDF